MKSFIIRLFAGSFTVALVMALIIGASIALSPGSHNIRPRGVTEEVTVSSTGTLGNDRIHELASYSRLFADIHPEVSADIIAGKALAPTGFLNEQLARHHLKWRVRKVVGAQAKIFDIS